MAFTLPNGTPLNLIQHGLGNNLIDYAVQNGYTGSLESGGGDVGQLSSFLGYSPDQLQAVQRSINANPNGRSMDELLGVKLSQQARDKQALDWLTSQGYQASGVDTGLEWIQQLLDPSGNLVATDAYNYNNTNKGVNQLGMAGALLVGGAAALGGLGGAGAAGAAGGTGTGTLGAGATGAGITTQGIGAAELAGLGLSNSAPLAMAPTFGAGTGLTTAGIGASELAGLGLSNSAPLAMAPSASGLAGYGTAAGLGGSALSDAAAQVASEQIGTGSLVDAGLTGSGPLGNLGGWSDAANAVLGSGGVGAGGFLGQSAITTGAGASSGLGGLSGVIDSIRNSGVGQAVGTVSDAVGGGRNLAGIIGGIAGATQGGQTDTSTVERKTDPRFDPYLYGDNGYLAQLQQQFNATRNGNPDMTAGADMLRNLYTSPAYSQGYEQMRSMGQGLLGQGVAGNPFTNPGGAPAGLLGSFTPVPRGQMPGGLLPIPADQRRTIMPVTPGRGSY